MVVRTSRQKVTCEYSWVYPGGSRDGPYRPAQTITIASDDKPARVRSRKPTGWLYPKPYTRNVMRDEGVSGQYRRRMPDGTIFQHAGHLSFQGVASYGVPLTFDPYHQDRALTAAMLQLKGNTWDAATTLAEAGKTADFVGKTASTIGRAFLDVKKGRFASAARRLGMSTPRNVNSARRSLASKWLAYQYGWIPLLGDVENMTDALADASLGMLPVLTGKGFSRHRERIDERHNVGTDFPFQHQGYKEDFSFVRLDFLPRNFDVAKLKELNLISPWQTAWELVPLSFVVDWFLPVGDFVSCFDYDAGLDFLSGSLTSVSKYDVSTSPHYDGAEGIMTWICSGHSRALAMQRSIYDSAPTPSMPRPKPHLGFRRMLSGLSLLSQAFR